MWDLLPHKKIKKTNVFIVIIDVGEKWLKHFFVSYHTKMQAKTNFTI